MLRIDIGRTGISAVLTTIAPSVTYSKSFIESTSPLRAPPKADLRSQHDDLIMYSSSPKWSLCIAQRCYSAVDQRNATCPARGGSTCSAGKVQISVTAFMQSDDTESECTPPPSIP